MGAKTNGCGTCKRRKVKCDDIRPNCNRCRKAGIECTGYGQRVRFVNENPRIQRSLAISQAQALQFSTTRDKIRQSLPLTAFKNEILISYLLSKLFEGYGRERRCGLPNIWASELVENTERPRHKSWDALAAIVFGQAHRRQDVITEGLELYRQALSELRNKLSDPDDRETESVLASMTALYMYEILWSKSLPAWMLHANGLGSLMELRGPWHQKSYAGTSISLEHRIMLVAKSIISRQSTFLHSLAWRIVPWEDDPRLKSATDHLVDIGTDIAEHLVQIRTLHDRQNKTRIQYCQIETQVAASLAHLNTWWQQWESEHRHCAWEVPASPMNSEPLFSTLLEYDTMCTAFTVSVYDMMRILLLQLMQRIQCIVGDAQLPPSERIFIEMPKRTVLLGISSDIKALAGEILRSLTYCYEKSPSLVGTFSFLFIQDVAYGCFDPGSREAQWIVDHGWAKVARYSDAEDANLLRRLLPLGQIRLDRD